MKKYKIKKKLVSATGIASLGWHLGHGYIQEKIRVRYKRWCVLENGKIIAECRGKAIAEKIAEALKYKKEHHGL